MEVTNSPVDSRNIFALSADRALWTLYIIRAVLTGPGMIILLPCLYFRYHTLRYTFDKEGIHMRVGILFRREVKPDLRADSGHSSQLRFAPALTGAG